MKRKVREFALLPVLLICFANNKHGWAADYNIILHTNVGGTSWTRQRTGLTGRIDDVFFTSPDTGTAVGDEFTGHSMGGIIIRTTDGRKTWTEQEIPVKHDLQAVFFTDAGTGTTDRDKGSDLHAFSGGEPAQKYRQDAFAWILSQNRHYHSISNSRKQ